jgi:hypothetical protein
MNTPFCFLDDLDHCLSTAKINHFPSALTCTDMGLALPVLRDEWKDINERGTDYF